MPSFRVARLSVIECLHSPEDSQSLHPLKPLLIVTRQIRFADEPKYTETVSAADLGLRPTDSPSVTGPDAQEHVQEAEVVFTWRIIFVPDVLQEGSFELAGATDNANPKRRNTDLG